MWDIGLGKIGQGWFGVICGTAIALGIGLSFGFILPPRVDELATKVFQFNPSMVVYASIGFVVASVVGIVVIGFVNR